MNLRIWLAPAVLLVSTALPGCKDGTTGAPKQQSPSPAEAARSDDATDAKANLVKLSPEDRKLAEEQGFCVIETSNPLGSMGVPYKVMIKDQPVFLCCDSCETRARAHADRTLARVQQLREKTAGTPPK